jgi:tetratricopeptide (TPR) repeat protein
MYEIFVSYSSKHRELTQRLVRAFEEQYGPGSVWWDCELESRAPFAQQIRAQLEKSRIVVVVWTAEAAVSDYVYAEAIRAQEAGKLVNVLPAGMSFRNIPEPFNVYHFDAADDYEKILVTIAKVMAGTPIPTRVPLHELYFRQHGVRLIDPKLSELPRDAGEIGPSELLQARFAVVPYADITGLKADFLAWSRNGRANAGRLVHGSGGLGKTRLMIEVAAALRAERWMAGFLDRSHDLRAEVLLQHQQALDQLIDHGDDAGLLIVMDYAESRQDQVRTIAERLARRPADAQRPIRLVLLARSAGEWWEHLHDEALGVQRVFRRGPLSADVIELPPVATGRQRLDLFEASVASLSPILHAQGHLRAIAPLAPARLARIESGIGYARPLAIQMEALLFSLMDSPDADEAGVDVLLDRVLGAERTHWRKLMGGLDDERRRDMDRGVAQVTAVAGAPSAELAERLLMADPFYAGRRIARVDVAPVLGNLQRVYGRDDGEIAKLEPDLIGEHQVARIADVDLIEGCLAWTGSAGMREPLAALVSKRGDLIMLLQRATQPEHGTKAVGRAAMLLDHIVRTHAGVLAPEIVAAMSATPGKLRGILETSVDRLNLEALRALDFAMPPMHLQLLELALGISRRHAALSRAVTEQGNSPAPDKTHSIYLAAALGQFGSRLAALGQREEALTARKEVVDIWRMLAEDRPDTVSSLAGSLNNLGLSLSDIGRHEEALSATKEAADILRGLANERPDTFRLDFALSLNNLANRLSDIGRLEESLAASKEAVETYRALTKDRAEAILSGLAISVNGLGLRLSKLGRREEALTASKEAVDIWRSLVGEHPDAFLPHLAMTLYNLGSDLSDLGRREEARTACQEAVDIYRKLASDRPDAFLPDLAKSVNNLSTHLSSLGQQQAALSASQEALDAYRTLAKKLPDAFLPDLAMSLINVSAHRFRLGQREAGLSASQEALDTYRALAKTRPDAFLPDVAKSLNNITVILGELGRREEALAAAREAVDTYRALAKVRPNAFSPSLAGSLTALGIALSNIAGLPGSARSLRGLLSNARRRKEALVATGEAVDVYRALAEGHPQAFLPDLARSLNSLGMLFSYVGWRRHALGAAAEAVEIYRALAKDRPEAFLPDLAMCLNNLSADLYVVRRREEALSVAKEAVDIRRALAKEHPDAHLPDLARSLGTLSETFSVTGRYTEAVDSLWEGLSMVAPLIEGLPQAFGDLARRLSRDYNRACKYAGREPDIALLQRVARALDSQ